MPLPDLFERAFRILWWRKYLLGFGIVIAVLSGVGSDNVVTRPLLRAIPYDPADIGRLFPSLAPLTRLIPDSDPGALLYFARRVGLPGLYWLLGGILLLAILLAIMILLLRGALIAGVATADEGHSLGQSLRTGWQRTWWLLIVASIPAIPITAALILIVGGLTIFIQALGGLEGFIPRLDQTLFPLGILAASMLLFLPALLLSLFLGLLWPLAERACVLANRRPVESFSQAWFVLRHHPGQAFLVYALQWLLNMALSSLTFVPGLLVFLCAGFIPVLWLLAGAKIALSSALWTLAWQSWMPEAE